MNVASSPSLRGGRYRHRARQGGAGRGAPLVLMADRQPTGGYPKIAHVIGADLGALAQLRPGEPVSFTPVSWDEAVAARRRLHADMAKRAEFAPSKREEFPPEFLLSQNLIGGVVSASISEM